MDKLFTKQRKGLVMKTVSRFLMVGLVSMGVSGVLATPTSQTWIPSTDFQDFGVPHLGFLSFIRDSDHGYLQAGQRDPDMFDGGFTIGVLPLDSVKMEVGVDYLSTFSGSKYDDHPVYFNAKLGVPEGIISSNAPAIVVGGYNFGTKYNDATKTDQNIVYGLTSKTLPEVCSLPSLGRISAGYYVGNSDVLTGPNGESGDNQGVLLSWDRTMSEINDKLWFGVDYMGGQNANGALSFGVAWNFTPNLSLLVGYDIWNKKSVAGANTITTQLGMNF